MRCPSLTLACSLLLLPACGEDDPSGTGETSESTTDVGDGDGDVGDGDGDDSATGDGDGDEPPPTPAALPSPTGACPSFASGNVEFAPADIAPRQVKVWVGDEPMPGGMLVLYWHAYGSIPNEAEYALSTPVIDAITTLGGIVAAPFPADDVGEFPWFAVNASPRQDDMLLGDEIVACSIQELGIDPRRIHVAGMSAGGIQTTSFSMARSRYVASVVSFSGGEFNKLEFEDPSNRFAAMIVHGGDNDIFGGFVNFKMLSSIWYGQLIENGNFAFMCDHGMGHTLPQGWGADVANFFYAHPFGTEPSPYAEGLPPEMPAACSL